MVEKEFCITRKSAPFVFEVCKAVKQWQDLFDIDPNACEFHVKSVNSSSKNILIRIKNLGK